MSTFDVAFSRTLGHEGVYSTDRADPGNYTPSGEFLGTKYGISARAYPGLDIERLTLAEAKDIYRRDYWDALRLDEMPPRLAIATFDAAVNSGRRPAAMWLQRALDINADGIVGPVTLAAANNARDVSAVLARMLGWRLSHMTDLAIWPSQGRGWARRIAHQLIEG